MIGKTISHYKILEKLGEGGMGVVYKAQDTKLKRIVALKFLLPQALGSEEDKTRFFNEARACAALDHANICTIHEIDEAQEQTFVAMGYVEGQSVKDRIVSGPLKLNEALDIAIQVAQGLLEAHEKGIVHRDIKSANIMVTPKGQSKIMDFGLAKVGKGSVITKEGTTLGTAAYMSPEQARGEVVDRRTDIWSLGVVLYEMISGRRPFKADYEQAVVYTILNEEPEPITALRTGVPMELERIVNKALAKNPDQRYQHADELMVDLRGLRQDSTTDATFSTRTIYRQPQKKGYKPILITGIMLAAAIIIIAGYFLLSQTRGPTTPGLETAARIGWKNSIAVLPFRDFSPNKDQEYFCDGMTDAIIGKLTGLKGLKVISMSSVMRFKELDRDIRKIGDELAVAAILEGSIQKEEDSIRVRAQLINVTDNAHLWSQTYDRKLESVFAIQDDISQAIVNVMKIRLLGEERAAFVKRHTENLEAYNAYVQGRFLWNKRVEEHLMKAIEYFEKAIELDPNYALAYAGLADAYSVLPSNIGYPVEEAIPKAKEAARKALELDNKLAEAHASMGLALANEGDLDNGEKEYKKAIELNPGYAYAHYWYSLILSHMGRQKESLNELETAYELNPLSVVILTNLASKKAASDDTLKAEELFKRAIEVEPGRAATYSIYARFLGQMGKVQEAEELMRRALEIEPNRASTYTTLAGGLREIGRVEEAIELYHQALEIDSTSTGAYNGLAYSYNQIGDFEKALWAADKNVELNPYIANPYDTRGEIYALNGKTKQAIENYKRALEKNPDFLASLKHLATVYLLTGKWGKAENIFKEIASSEDRYTALAGRNAEVLVPLHQGKIKRALEILDSPVTTDTSGMFQVWEKASKHSQKLFIYWEQEKFDLALKEIEILKDMLPELDPKDKVKLRDAYAITWMAQGQTAKAERVLKNWRNEISESDSVQLRQYWRVLGIIEFFEGNPDSSIVYLKKGLWEGSKPIFEIRYLLAQAYLDAGQPNKAVEELEKALSRYDEFRASKGIWAAKAHYYLGMAYQELGRDSEAMQKYEEFLDIWKNADPGIKEMEDAKQRLEQLKVES
jgi:serine/threonine protein kinase/tetratricopeptide (TPR) repeat protein